MGTPQRGTYSQCPVCTGDYRSTVIFNHSTEFDMGLIKKALFEIKLRIILLKAWIVYRKEIKKVKP